jgi:hypothetical protein
MTWHQARAVLDIEGMSTSQKIVLMALSLRAGNDGRAWPSIARLCADTGLSDRAARYALHALADAGHLVMHRHPGRGLTVVITAAPVAGAPRHHVPRPRQISTPGAAPGAGRSNKEEELKYAPADTSARRPAGATNITGGPAPGESWGEYRERGGR